MLGVVWSPEKDNYTFKANRPEKDFPLMKRNFLIKIVKLFDPLGFVTPFVIRTKILLHEISISGLDWDDLFQEQEQEEEM